jgi:hypothetical protein
VLNGKSLDFNTLNEAEINTKIPGSRYWSREMHTNFKLDDDGETLYLWDENGGLADKMSFSHLQPDISFGRFPDGSDSLRCFKKSTPGRKSTN